MNKIHFQNIPIGYFEVYDDCPGKNVIQVHQEHTNTVVEYLGEDIQKTIADGIITSPDILGENFLAVKTADCLPIFMWGEKVAMIHAGWKGLANEILSNELLTQLQWQHAIIGPCILNYEVQEDFKENFPNSSHFQEKEGQLYFNLVQEAVDQLQKNFDGIQIHLSNICTLQNKEYNSYRRDKTKQRNWNVFRIK